MRAATGFSARARSVFQLTDCLRGHSPSYDRWQGRWPGQAPSPDISAGMRKNTISVTGLSLRPGDSSSCSSCQLPRRLRARWPLRIFLCTDAAAAAARAEPGQCRPAAGAGQEPSGHGGGPRCLCWACMRRGATTNVRCGPPGWPTTVGLISGCSESRLIRTLTGTFGVCFQPCGRVEAGHVPGPELLVLLRDRPALGSPAAPGSAHASASALQGTACSPARHPAAATPASFLTSVLAAAAAHWGQVWPGEAGTKPVLVLCWPCERSPASAARPSPPGLGPCHWCRLGTVGAGGRGAV